MDDNCSRNIIVLRNALESFCHHRTIYQMYFSKFIHTVSRVIDALHSTIWLSKNFLYIYFFLNTWKIIFYLFIYFVCCVFVIWFRRFRGTHRRSHSNQEKYFGWLKGPVSHQIIANWLCRPHLIFLKKKKKIVDIFTTVFHLPFFRGVWYF